MAMDCKELEKWIPFFMEDTLSNKELQSFMEHIEKCGECREELSIYYLINEGMLRLEDGNVFDLQQVMDSHMERAASRLRRRKLLQWVIYGLVTLMLIVIVVMIVLLSVMP